MFIVKGLRFLRGYLLVEGSGGYIERMLNLISQKNISCWNIHIHQYQISCMVFAKDYRRITKFAKKTGVRIRIKEKYGVPFLLKKRRKRDVYKRQVKFERVGRDRKKVSVYTVQ